MSFSLFPPEVNSAAIYTGPGSAPLQTAATAWTSLSADLMTTATSTHSVIANLDSTWTGAGSAAATAATAPYVAWLQQASATAAQMAAQATTAAGLFEAARSASVPPAVIAANRALLLALIATNFFGQNSTAIASTEAQYEAMWAQDGVAMDTYDTASQTNNAAMQQQPPPPNSAQATQPGPATGNGSPVVPGGDPTGGTTATGYDFSTIGQLLHTLGVPQATINSMDPSLMATSTQSVSQVAYYPMTYGSMAMRYLMMLQQFARMGSMGSSLAGQTAGGTANGTGTLMTQIGEFVNEKLQGAVGTLAGHFTTATNAISAKLGQAASMGALKVPQAWSMAADGMVRAAPVLPATTVSAPIQTMSATSGLPGGPFGNAMMGAMAGRGLGAVAAKAPKVMPRSPAGG